MKIYYIKCESGEVESLWEDEQDAKEHASGLSGPATVEARTVHRRKSIEQAARGLAEMHKKNDPETMEVHYFPTIGEDICIVEITEAVGPTDPPEILPLRFAAMPEHDIPFRNVVILLHPEEWKQVLDGKARLPNGWNLNESKRIL